MEQKMVNSYGLFGILQLIYFKIRTFFLFKKARLIRFPLYLRGKKYVSIGEGFTTGVNCRIDAFPFKNNTYRKLIIIGKNVQINDNVHIAAIERIEIHNDVLIASKVFISDHNHGNYSGESQDSPLSIPSQRPLSSKPIIIEEKVWIGEFVSIVAGVTIGKGSIIGSMAFVNKDIPPYSFAVGSPAKVIKQYDFEKNEWNTVS